ncbi:hypothetical protein [Caldimonas sp. KR1-144]|uniref:hypothetical protein n=1 Tax=Caldimonas sp. KR1-144 TaxID=3400911 RepID=UPI003C0114BE
MKSESLLAALIHIANAAWITRFSFLFSTRRNDDYLHDQLLLASLALVILFNTIRWIFLSRAEHKNTYTSQLELSIELRSTAAKAFGFIPYLIKAIPSEQVISARAASLLADTGELRTEQELDLLRALLSTPKLMMIHWLILLFIVTIFASGQIPTSIGSIEQLWPLHLPIIVAAIGVSIYSAVAVIFTLIYE